MECREIWQPPVRETKFRHGPSVGSHAEALRALAGLRLEDGSTGAGFSQLARLINVHPRLTLTINASREHNASWRRRSPTVRPPLLG